MSAARLAIEANLRAEEDRALMATAEVHAAPQLTLADDCAELLQAWWQERAMRGSVRVHDFELRNLVAKFRALGVKP